MRISVVYGTGNDLCIQTTYLKSSPIFSRQPYISLKPKTFVVNPTCGIKNTTIERNNMNNIAPCLKNCQIYGLFSGASF